MNKEAKEILEMYRANNSNFDEELAQAIDTVLQQASLVDTLKEKILEEIDICKQAIKICEITRECHYNLDNRLEFLNAWLKISEGN